MTLKEWLNQSLITLESAGISNFSQEIYWILKELGQIPKHFLFQNPDLFLEPEKLQKLKDAVTKRSKRIPLQYILGYEEFMGLNFHVNQNVLIPRPETKELVQWAIETLKPDSNVLEIGTGSGCIAISLKHYRPDLNITSVDISQKALLVAEINMKEILGDTQIQLIHSNLFDNILENDFDVILSNPPYLSEQDMENISEELTHEPEIALSCHGDGFDIYRALAKESKNYLKKEGLIALEIGINQSSAIKNIFNQFLFLKEIQDFQGIIRDLIFKIQ